MNNEIEDNIINLGSKEQGTDEALTLYFNRISTKFQEEPVICKKCHRNDNFRNQKQLKAKTKYYNTYEISCLCGNKQKINVRHAQDLVAKSQK